MPKVPRLNPGSAIDKFLNYVYSSFAQTPGPMTVNEFEPLVNAGLLKKFTGDKVASGLAANTNNGGLGKGFFLDKEGDLYYILNGFHETTAAVSGLADDMNYNSFKRMLADQNLIRIRKSPLGD